jgi:hypothetical protein
MMNRRNFGRRSGVIVDVCRSHGVWFDPSELTSVLAFVARGGITAAKSEAEQELARRRAAALVGSPAPIGVGRAVLVEDSAGALLVALAEWLV